MADLKPLGSEKLNGDDKLKRILELTYYNNNNKSSSSSKTAELVRESTNGSVYGIVKEKDGYYVKKGLNESSLDYIGGMFMKNKNKFSSYSDAFKRLELLKGQEELQEATKYVLKQTKPQEESPMAEPSLDVPAAPEAGGDVPPPADDMGAGEVPMDASAEEPAGELPPVDGESKRSDYMAEAQKYAGKLGQELRDLHDKMESDDIKYILNMIISAVDLDKLDDEDIEEIGKKFEREEEVGGEEPTGEVPAEEPTSDEEPVSGDEDLGETMDLLNSFIESPIGDEEETNELDLSHYADIEASEETQDDIQELDLDEIKNDINQAISEKLSKYFK